MIRAHTPLQAAAAPGADHQKAGAVQTAQLQGESTAMMADTSTAASMLQRHQQLANGSPQAMQLQRRTEIMSGSRSDTSRRETHLQKEVVQRTGGEELLQGELKAAQLQREEDLLPERKEGTPLKGRLTLSSASFAPPTKPVLHEEKPNDTGMPNQLKSGIESLSGMGMDQVKVHYNSDKPAQLRAHAYAQGSEIHVGPGQERHLPHEAWHVVQQAQGRVTPTMQMKAGVVVNNDAGLEAEADRMGSSALAIGAQQGQLAATAIMAPSWHGTVAQRVPDDELDQIIEQVNAELSTAKGPWLPDTAKDLYLSKYPNAENRKDQARDFVVEQFRKRTMLDRAKKQEKQAARATVKAGKREKESKCYTSCADADSALTLLTRMLLTVSDHMNVRPLIAKMCTSLRSDSCSDCRVTLKGYLLELFLSYVALEQGGTVQEPEGKADALFAHNGTQFAVQAKYGTPTTLSALARSALYQLMGLSAGREDKPQTAEKPPDNSVRTAHLFVEGPTSDFDELAALVLHVYNNAYQSSKQFTLSGQRTRVVFDLYDSDTQSLSQRVMDFPHGSPNSLVMTANIKSTPQTPNAVRRARTDHAPNAGDVVGMANLISSMSPMDRIVWMDGTLSKIIAPISG